ncbi:MAG: hypothetical protein M1839_004896 [Geoglossum umbratile]|nr:MAG: hypothetical protein M1839_004896 [Geoglossum umbratile]
MSIILRPPGGASADSNWIPPPIDWLEGTWHVTHSTLPQWRTKKNVRITYKSLPPGEGARRSNRHRLDDSISYQDLNSDKIKTIHGIDKTSRSGNTGTWGWRGTGTLFFITSHWEVLGWGGCEDDDPETVLIGKECGPLPITEEHNDWIVTYFAKTLFTPAGIDIYSRSKDGVSPGRLARIRAALSEVDDGVVRRLAGEIFEVLCDTTEST